MVKDCTTSQVGLQKAAGMFQKGGSEVLTVNLSFRVHRPGKTQVKKPDGRQPPNPIVRLKYIECGFGCIMIRPHIPLILST